MMHKYRAYNTKLKKMQEVLSIELHPETGGVEVWGKSSVDYLTGEQMEARDFWPWDDIELMQFTGSKDKNGKDGCAGDLVKMFNRSLFVIAWHEYYARFQLELVKGYKELQKVHDMGMLQFSEIVGNIYENHDLMEAGEV